MTVSSQTTPRAQSTGNGSTTNFSFNFPVLEDDDVLVTLEDANGDAVSSTLDGVGTYDYSISGTYDDDLQRYPSGVNVVFNTAPPANYTITRTYNIDRLQGADYVDNDAFPAETHERALDKLTLIIQELDEFLLRVPRFPTSSSLTEVLLPGTLTANAVVSVNAAGTAFEMGPTVTEIEDAEAEATAAAASAAAALTSENNAATSETNAAASALAAAAAAASNLFNTVSSVDDGDSPVTVTANTDDGTMFIVDSASGNVTLNLPSVATALSGERYGFLRVSASNTVTIARDGTDTINGVDGNYTVNANAGELVIVVADEGPSPNNWVVTIWTQAVAGSGLSKSGSTISLDLTADQTWTGSQRSTPSDVTDGTLDMDAAQDFNYTPGAADTLEFSNEADGQRGLIRLVNPSGYTITLGSEVKAGSSAAADLSIAGTYLISYWCYDGTNVAISYGEDIS